MFFTIGSPRFGVGSSIERRTLSWAWRRTGSRGLSNCRFNNQQSKAGLRLRPKTALPSLSAILFEARLRVKGKRDLGPSSSPGAKEKFTTERTEITDKSTSSRKQGLQGYSSSFLGPQSLPASPLCDLYTTVGEFLCSAQRFSIGGIVLTDASGIWNLKFESWPEAARG